MQNLKKLIPLGIIAGLFCSTSCWAVLPPKYLSVENWKNCVGTMKQDSAEFVCLPATMPEKCKEDSWNALQATNELSACPESK